MSQFLSPIIAKIDACLEIFLSVKQLDESHFKVLQAIIPSADLYQSVAEHYATNSDIAFSDIHLQFLNNLPIEWNDRLILFLLGGRCARLETSMQRAFVLKHLDASRQEWGLDLLDTWLNTLTSNAMMGAGDDARPDSQRNHDKQGNAQSTQSSLNNQAGQSTQSTQNTQDSQSNQILSINILKFFHTVLQETENSANQVPLLWKEKVVRALMLHWEKWSKEESDFVFRNILNLCLDKSICKDEILVWLWRMARAKCGLVLKPEDSDEDAVTTTVSSIDVYTPHILDARNIAYQIPCQFFDHFMSDSSKVDLRMKENFWLMLIEGLRKSHSFIMKRSEYLLRRIIDMSQTEARHSSYTKYFPINRNSKDLYSLWSIWFMLWESIQSNSTHLLLPVWGQVFSFFPLRSSCEESGSVNPSLHPSWTEILFHHVFNHDNFGAQKLAMASFYEFDFTKYVATFNIDYVLHVLFTYGDFAKLYSDKYKIGERMIRFLTEYAKQIAEGLVYDPLVNTEETVPNLVRKIIAKIAEDPVKVTYCGVSYLFKAIISLPKDQLALPESENLLSTQLVQQLDIIVSQNIFINGGWVKVRQCALVCQLLAHLGTVDEKNIDTVSQLLSRFSRNVFLPSVDTLLSAHIPDEILLSEIHKLLEAYYSEKDSHLESQNDVKMFSDSASRIARLTRFVSAKENLLQLLADRIGAVFDGIYSRSYLSSISKFKSLMLTSVLLYEYSETVLESRLDMHNLLVQVLILPHLEEITSFSASHLAYPEIVSTTDVTPVLSLFKKGSQMILCDEPLLNILESALLHCDSLRNDLFFSFVKTKILEPTICFIEHLTTVFGSTYVRNVDPALGTISNLYILRALKCFSLVSKCASILNQSPIFAKDTTLLKRAFSSTFGVPFIPVNRASEVTDASSFFLIYPPSELAAKLCKDKWEAIFEWLSFFRTNNSSQPSDDELIDVMYAAQDALDLVQSRHVSLPIACISLVLNIIKDTKVPVSDLKTIFNSCESATKGTGHGTDIEAYYALMKLLLGQKQSLDEDFVRDVLNPKLTSLIKLSVSLPRITTAIAFQIGSALLDVNCSAERKKALVPFIFQLLGVEHEDISQVGHESIERVHTQLGVTDIDRELSKFYPPAMNYEKQSTAIIYLSIQNLPPGSESFVEHLLVSYFKNEGKGNKARIAPNGVVFNTIIRSGKVALLASRYLTEEMVVRNFDLFWNSIHWDYILSAKRLVDFFLVVLLCRFPIFGDRLMKDLSDFNASSGVLISGLILLGSFLVYGPDKRFIERAPSTWDLLIAYSNSTHHNIRTIAQAILCSLVRRRDALVQQGVIQAEELPISNDLRTVQKFIEETDSSMKWIAKYHPVFLFDPFITSEPKILFYHPLEAHDKTDVMDHVPLSVVKAVKDNGFGVSSGVCNIIERDVSRLNYYLENWKIQRSITSFLDDVKPKDRSYRKYVDEFIGIYAGDEECMQDGEESLQDFNIDDMNFQRKIVPWHEMDINNELNPRSGRTTERHSIIVCATFVDKIPNLAGLTRTSEIFNVEKLVISNKGVLKQDMFKSIAVTAEQWMPIEEVSEDNLMTYLNEQKENGYSIIGLEQTADSVPIDVYEFPKKCVILLGKEKEGIPTEYLQLLDACVEIQQFGLIRSLNVHVSASIMIYEYTKQHFMTGKQ